MLGLSRSDGSRMQSVPGSWLQAQQYEVAGAWDQARSSYESILAAEPDHVPARLRMSRLEQLARRYAQSRQHALRAADAVRLKGSTRHIGFVTARLMEFADEAEAASVILSADWNDQDVIRQSPSLAQHLWLAGRYEDALRFLDAIAQHARHPLLALTHANVLRYLGDMAGAEREYEACLGMAPDLADAHWALSTHSRAQPALSRVSRLKAAIERQNDPLALAHLRYALFREFDAAGETAQAWESLWHGMALMRTRVRHDAADEAARLQTLMQAPFALPAMPRQEPEGPWPIFVVGMPRTGTTLLDRILGNHGWVYSLGERNDFSAAVSETSDRFFQSMLHGDPMALMQLLDHARVGHLYQQRIRLVAPPVGRVTDKNPRNLFSIPMILQALPQARIVCLRRDPMDACFSNLKELFQGDAYPYSYSMEDVADHCLLARRWMEYWQQIAPGRVRVVDYESLIERPEAVTASLLEFLGLPAQAGMHDITRNQAPVSTASSSQVREGMHRRGIGAWKRYEAQLQPLRERLEALA